MLVLGEKDNNLVVFKVKGLNLVLFRGTFIILGFLRVLCEF